jgi:acyl-CoA thioesterase-1
MTSPSARRGVALAFAATLLNVLIAGMPTPATAAPTAASCVAPSEFLRLSSSLPRTAAHLAAHQKLRIVAIGSSSTFGYGASSPAHTYPSRFARELQRRLPGEPIEVLNKGVSGETSVDMMARFDRDVFAADPDLVIWQVGTNAVLRHDEVRDDIAVVRQGVARLKAAGVDVILMDMQYAPRVVERPRYDEMERAIAAIAKEEGVGLFRRFDLMHHWVASEQFSFATMLAADQLHMNDTSYACVGRILAAAVASRLAPAPVLTSQR